MTAEQWLASVKRAAIIGAAKMIVNTPIAKLEKWL